ncbi:MAG: phosphoglycerate mutase family protein [Chitinophagaceae bacterium]
MRHLVYFFICLCFIGSSIQAQSTFYLVRHAEKDTVVVEGTMMQNDVALSQKGLYRANQLAKRLASVTIDSIYSTPYVRTKSTAQPTANQKKLTVQTYDPRKLKEFADWLLTHKNKTCLVVGHSNTTPALVNLLLKENKFPPLDESIYNQLYIVTVKDNKATVTIETYE